MKILSTKDKEAVSLSAQIITQGRCIVFPTDTAYGLGVNALDPKAIKKLSEIKGGRTKPIHMIVPDIKEAEKYAFVTKEAKKLAKAFLPGTLTLILEKKDIVPNELVAGLPTVGIRIPNTPLALDIVSLAGVPITATSANKTGGKTPYSVEEVKISLAESWKQIDYVIDIGTLPGVAVSTIVDMTKDRPTILREGPISREEILNVLG